MFGSGRTVIQPWLQRRTAWVRLAHLGRVRFGEVQSSQSSHQSSHLHYRLNINILSETNIRHLPQMGYKALVRPVERQQTLPRSTVRSIRPETYRNGTKHASTKPECNHTPPPESSSLLGSLLNIPRYHHHWVVIQTNNCSGSLYLRLDLFRSDPTI